MSGCLHFYLNPCVTPFLRTETKEPEPAHTGSQGGSTDEGGLSDMHFLLQLCLCSSALSAIISRLSFKTVVSLKVFSSGTLSLFTALSLTVFQFDICKQYSQFSIAVFFFGHAAWLVGSQFPDQGLNLGHGGESAES